MNSNTGISPIIYLLWLLFFLRKLEADSFSIGRNTFAFGHFWQGGAYTSGWSLDQPHTHPSYQHLPSQVVSLSQHCTEAGHGRTEIKAIHSQFHIALSPVTWCLTELCL
jgi:hypothetical protein